MKLSHVRKSVKNQSCWAGEKPEYEHPKTKLS